MTELSTYKKFYFIGIGGIGMSALARYFRAKNFDVAGYDRTPSELTESLEHIGISLNFEDSQDIIPQQFKSKADTLIIYTPAVPKDHHQLNYFINNGFEVRKRAEVLADVTKDKFTIAVAGTHGKTSTATLIAHILYTAKVPFVSFLGGISSNYNTNYIEVGGKKAQLAIVEADEYDRSFHRLNPDTSIITAIEADHLDIYGTVEELEKAYGIFAQKTKAGGRVIAHSRIAKVSLQNADWKVYDTKHPADFYAENIRVENGKFVFDAILGDIRLNDLKLGVPGNHNVENAIAAMAASLPYIAEKEYFYTALETFRGVKRRFEFVYQNENTIFIDDYAHHPTEIEVTLQTVKKLYPKKEITAVFQPHLFSRTRDMAQGFAESLSLADRLYLLPIYPAREKPIEGVTTEIIYNLTNKKQKLLIEKEALLEEIKNNNFEVLLTIGAGDIDRLVEPIEEILKKRKMQAV